MVITSIGYLTDVEGNYSYFESYVQRSNVLSYADKERTTLQLKDDTMFVFGGDVCDKGIGSIRVARQLVALKKKYGDRVILIVGNRDINKMRWTSELEDTEIINGENVPGPYWVKPEVRVSPLQYVSKLVEADATITPENKAKAMSKANNIPNRIRWMLDATMGAAGDFERRREELSIIHGKQDISDEDVAKSYMQSVRPGGEMFELLHLGQLAFIHEETLFLHGGLTKDNMGYVPFAPARSPNIHDWVRDLNAWYREEVVEWVQRPTWLYASKVKVPILKDIFSSKFDPKIQGPPPKEVYEDKSKWAARGGHRLLDYVVTGTIGSVIYTNMFNKANNCRPTDPSIGKKLNEFGIKRIVVGHQPHGYAPAIAKDEYLELIDADTSYSDMTAKDNRGQAVSEVLIKGKDVFVQGITSAGVEIKYQISLVEGQGDPYIGRRVYLPDDKDDNGFWVKAKFAEKQEDGKSYILCKVNGFVVEYATMSDSELARLFPGKGETIRTSRDQPDVTSIKLHEKVVPITKSPGVQVPLREIVRTQFFKTWAHNLAPDFNLAKIEIQSADVVGPHIRFVKLFAHLTNQAGHPVPGVTFLRGNSVAVLLVLDEMDTPKKTKWAVVIRHPRAAIGEYSHLEIPVGYDGGMPLGTIKNLMENEVGIEISERVINMNEVLYGYDKPIFMSPGASDEGMRFFLVESAATSELISEIKNKAKSGDLSVPELIPLDELALQCNDAKSILAAHLYELYQKKTGHTKKGKKKTLTFF